MFDRLRSMLDGLDVDYADARHEVRRDGMVRFDGKELSQIGTNTTDGFVVRVLDGGGLASVAFTRPDDAERAVATAAENARLIGRHRAEPVRFAPAEPVRAHFAPALDEDPRQVPIEEKLDLVRRYNAIPLAHAKVATTMIAYQDIVRTKHFLSTEGAEIREELVTTRLAGEIIAREGSLTENVRLGAGGSDGFARVRGQEEYLEERTRIAIDLLDARPVEGGAHRCVLNPSLSGVFTHEAFGHFSEADIIETLPAMRAKMGLGAELGREILNIKDDATVTGQLGFYRYDDEGVPVRPVPLIENGVLVGRLHSRRTAAEFDEPLSGHTVAEDYRYAPIIRMGCIFIESGADSLDELLAKLGNGYYFLDAKGGQTAGENFSFGTQYGYEVKGGRKGRMVRDINISGNLYSTLREISAVGSDFVLGKVGGCGKGQTNPRSCYGGPHVLVDSLVVGGV